MRQDLLLCYRTVGASHRPSNPLNPQPLEWSRATAPFYEGGLVCSTCFRKRATSLRPALLAPVSTPPHGRESIHRRSPVALSTTVRKAFRGLRGNLKFGSNGSALPKPSLLYSRVERIMSNCAWSCPTT